MRICYIRWKGWLAFLLIFTTILSLVLPLGVANVQAQNGGEESPPAPEQPTETPTEQPTPTPTPTPTETTANAPMDPVNPDEGIIPQPTETPTLEPTPTEEVEELAPLMVPEDGEIVPDEYIVVFKPQMRAAAAQKEVKAHVKAVGGRVNRIFEAVLNGFSMRLPPKALKALRKNPNVEYIEAEIRFDLSKEPLLLPSVMTNVVWGLDRIDQTTLPLNGIYQYQYTGQGVNVYIVDTGIRYSHAEFGGRAVFGFDSFNDGLNGSDCHGHGTHVAGTAGGATFGVAKEVQLYAVRVLNCSGSGTTSTVIAGLDWISRNHVKPAVVNMSLGGGISTSLDNAVNNLISKGVVVVAAAGNSNDNACNYSPARVPNAITVGATTSNDARSSFSNWGSCLDIFAPGSSIRSVGISSDTASALMSGTSMASPHVAGAAALYFQVNPGASVSEVTSTLLNISTVGVVVGAGDYSPNRMLYSLFSAGTSPTPTSKPTSTPTPNPTPTPIIAPPIEISMGEPNGKTYETMPKFNWLAQPMVEKFQLQVYRGTKVVIDRTVQRSECGADTCAVHAGTALSFADHKWRVRAWNNGGWEAFQPFTNLTVLPAIPATLAPIGVIYVQQPSFRWEHIPIATRYQIQVYQGKTLVNSLELGLEGCAAGQCTTTPELVLAYGTYRWRVRALVNETWQAFSPYRIFSVANPTPTLQLPGSRVYTQSPLFRWSRVTAASQYHFQVLREGEVMVEQYLDASICKRSACSYRIPEGLPYSAYAWRVRAYGAGQWWDFSAPKDLKVIDPIPRLSATLDVTTQRQLTFEWTSVEGATRYQLQVYNGSRRVVNQVIPMGEWMAESLMFTTNSELDYGTYRWRVRAFAGGTWRAFSAFQYTTIVALEE